MRCLLLVALLLGASISVAAAPPPVMTPAQTMAVADAQRRGRDLYDFDQAAWGSTDAMLAAVPDPAGAGVQGWIIEREPGGTIATFYGLRDAKAYKVFVAHMQGRKVLASHVIAVGEDNAMTPIEQRMVAARRVALSKKTFEQIGFQACENASINSVVMVPATPDEDVSVYILTPQTANDRYPFGGHYRVDVAATAKITNSRPFTKSCLAMKPQAPQGGMPAAMMVSHLLDPQPTEIHVWLSLVANIPVYVATMPSDEIWAVDRGDIRLIQTLSSKPAP